MEEGGGGPPWGGPPLGGLEALQPAQSVQLSAGCLWKSGGQGGGFLELRPLKGAGRGLIPAPRQGAVEPGSPRGPRVLCSTIFSHPSKSL